MTRKSLFRAPVATETATNAARAAAPVVAPETEGPARDRALLSQTYKSDFDVRKACNAIKRTSSLTSAAVLTGATPESLVALAETVSIQALERLGFDISKTTSLGSVMPMMLESVALVVGDAAHYGADEQEMGKAAEQIVKTMVEVSRTRSMRGAVEARWPEDMDNETAVRLSAILALTPVSIEIEGFDFFHKPSIALRHATRVVVLAAFEMVDELCPASASAHARSVFAQSALQSMGRLYASCWKREADTTVKALGAMSPAQRTKAAAEMAGRSFAEMMGPVDTRFAQTCADLNAASGLAVTAAAAPARNKP